MRFSVPFLILLLLFSTATLAQDVRYVSGNQSVPLRGGAGDDYQIVHRGIPAGARLTVARTSEDGLWADITTDSGDTGWIPTAKLLVELAPQTAVTAPGQGVATSEAANAGLVAGDPATATDPAELLNQISACDEQYNAVAQELHRLKQVSGKAEQLDIDNRRLSRKQRICALKWTCCKLKIAACWTKSKVRTS